MDNRNHIDWLQNEIEQSAVHFRYDVFASLLLIRQASQNADAGQLSKKENAFTPDRPADRAVKTTPWNLVVQAIDLPQEQYVPFILEALRRLPLPDSVLNPLIASVQSAEIEAAPFRKIVELLSNVSMEGECLSRIYENYLSREVRAATSKMGDFYTPQQVVRLLVQLLEIRGGDVYDPCCGSGAMLCAAAQMSGNKAPIRLYGQALSEADHQIGQTNLLLRGLWADLGCAPANTLLEDLHEKRPFSYILGNVPFNAKDWYAEGDLGQLGRDPRWHYGLPPKSNANYAWLQHIIFHLEENGCAAVLLPNGALTSQNRAERQIREGILRDHLVESVIALPGGLFYNTRVPCSMWVIHKQPRKNQTVLLIDGSHMPTIPGEGLEKDAIQRLLALVGQHRKGKLEEKGTWYAAVSLEELAQNQFNLSPNLYTRLEELPLAPMQQNRIRFMQVIGGLNKRIPEDQLREQITQWGSEQAAVHWTCAPLTDLYEIFGGVTKKKKFFGDGVPLVGFKDVIRPMYLSGPFSSRVLLSPHEFQKYSIYRGDVLMNRTSESIGELACCSVAAEDIPAVYGCYMKRLRPRRAGQIDPLYAAGYFRSAFYRQEVKRVSTVYTTRANINLEQLAKIRFYYPDSETQSRLGKILFAVSDYRQTCSGTQLDAELKEFVELLIEQHITCPIRNYQEQEGRS